MERRVVVPADVSGEALAELKNWLGISRPNEDALLSNLLLAGLEMFEAYSGQAPLSQLVEEHISTAPDAHCLRSNPVVALENIELISEDGARHSLEPGDYSYELTTASRAVLEITKSLEGHAVAVQVRCGIAQAWSDIPAGIKQGLIRLAAFHYRNRDRTGEDASNATPPDSVAAMWHPWRGVRLA